MVSVLTIIAGLVVLSWIWINAYHFYPMLMTTLRSAAGSSGRTSDGASMTEYWDNEGPAIASDDGGPALEAGESGPTVEADESSQPIESDGGRPPVESDGGLPSIDVLLPAYKEGEVIEHSIASVRAAEYDQRLITVNVLVEPDDDETRAALAAIDGEYEFRELVVPEDYPGEPNKPRALNYGFERTDAELVTILDAEDVVHPELYQQVVAKFAEGCDYVQGRLDMANEDDGWMNTLFRAEYGYWYKINTRAKYHCDYPIPLGGTTCFFPRTILREISERRKNKYGSPWDEDDLPWIADHGFGFAGHVPWDPNNVTEDFELGLFLWQEGYEAGYVESTPTKEESPLSLDAWMRQRTRWKKGKIYTFLQYLRHPPDGISEKMHIYSQSGVPHLGPVNFTSVVVLLLAANLLGYEFGPAMTAVLTTAFAFTLAMVGLYSYGYWTTTDQSFLTRLRRTTVVGCSLVIYWLMQWVADIRAIAQTYKGELHWAKTTHFGRHLDQLSMEPRPPGESNRWTLPHRRRFALLSGVLAAGVALRLYGLTSWSLWADELFSVVRRASQPMPELLTVPLSIDPHPPLYYVVLHYWMAAFGNTVLSVRLLSVVFALLAMGLLFRLGTEIFNDRVGLLATLLFALSPFHIHYGRQARMYSLFALLTIASWYGFVRLRNESRATTASYVVATVLLLYTHVYGLFVLAAQHLYVVLSERKVGVDLRGWLSVQAIVTALAIPWFGMLALRLVEIGSGSSGKRNVIGHLLEPSLGTVRQTLLRFGGLPSQYPISFDSPVARSVTIALTFLFVCALVFSWMRYSADRTYEFITLSSASQLSLLLIVPILVPILVSVLFIPVYSARFALPASIALFLLVARGILNIGTPKLRAALVIVAVVGLALTAGAYHNGDTAEDWSGKAACLDDNAEEDSAVLYQPFWIQDRMEYYNGRLSSDRYGVLPPGEIASRNVPHARNIDDIRRLAEKYEVVWVVREGLDDSVHLLEALNRTHEVTATATEDIPKMYKYVDRAATNGSDGDAGSACEEGASRSYFPPALTVEITPDVR